MNTPPRIIGTAVFLDAANIDTDTIFPKQFLRTTTAAGCGRYLFYHWQSCLPWARGARRAARTNRILLVRENFGCGSSREHAVWALVECGIVAVVSSGFAEIFYDNGVNNGLVLLTLPQTILDALFVLSHTIPRMRMGIDLKQTVVTGCGCVLPFRPNRSTRRVLRGENDRVGETLEHLSRIRRFEARRVVHSVEPSHRMPPAAGAVDDRRIPR